MYNVAVLALLGHCGFILDETNVFVYKEDIQTGIFSTIKISVRNITFLTDQARHVAIQNRLTRNG